MDCAGDEFAPKADGVFSEAPIFDCYGYLGVVFFSTNDVDRPYEQRYGSTSAFLPQ